MSDSCRQDSFTLSLPTGPGQVRFHRLGAGTSAVRECRHAQQIAAWLTQVVARPDERLGRRGALCPHVPGALAQGTVWIGGTDLVDSERAVDELVELLAAARASFLERNGGRGELLLTFLLVFPHLDDDRAVEVLLEAQSRCRMGFLREGLMLGEFFPGNDVPCLRNASFFPFQSPVPMLGMRHMVPEDVAFFELAARTDRRAAVRSLSAYVEFFARRGTETAQLVRARSSLARLRRGTAESASLGP